MTTQTSIKQSIKVIQVRLHADLVGNVEGFLARRAEEAGMVRVKALSFPSMPGSLFILSSGIETILFAGLMPFFFALLAFLGAVKARIPTYWAWALAGAVFSAFVAFVWTQAENVFFFAALGIGFTVLGAFLGEKIYRAVSQPSQKNAWVLIVVFSLFVPLGRGIIDLMARNAIP